MPHTLHPEIEKAILAITQERTVFRSYFDNESDLCKEDKKMIASLIRTYLGPYLLPPSQHLNDKPTMYVGDEGGQGGAEVHIYNTVKDNEPLPEKEIDDKTKLGIYDTTQNIMQDIRTYVYEYDEVQKMRLLALLDKHLLKFCEQKQSTPKIEKLVYEDILPDGKLDQLAVERNLANIIDYINNKD